VNKPGKSSLFKASLLAALLAAGFEAQAAGLGKLTVFSAIGQPLNAEVSLAAASDELISMSAKLASQDAFKEAGIDFMPSLAGVRFNIVKQTNNQAVLKLTTDRPLNEPFLHFLVELNWTSGRMVREYTFLLDPPEMLQASQPASVVSPLTPAIASPSQPIQTQPLPPKADLPAPTPEPVKAKPSKAVAAKPSAAPATQPKPVAASKSAASSDGGQEVRVKPGDTLSKIAREHKTDAVSLDQMLVALFNSNRDVFDAGNMNRLRAGKILRLPDPAEVAQIDGTEAHKLIVSQATDFNTYRRQLASAVEKAPPAETVPKQEASGKIKPQVEEKPAAPAPKDKLEVSRTEAAKSGKLPAKSSLEEDLISRDKALREAADRIADLEKNLDNLRKLVELKSQAGVQAQQQAQAAAPVAAKPESKSEPRPEAKSVQPAPVVASDKKPDVTPTVKPEEAKPEPAALAPAATPVVEKPAESAPVPAPATESAPPTAEVAPPAPPKPAPKKPLPPPPPPPPEPSFLEDNPQIVFGGGGILAILLGYFGFKAWSKKKREREEADFVDVPSVSASELASTSGAIFGAASESVDSGEVSIQGDFSEGGVLTTEESVDPVAEADVYMAYGRDTQAEEILREGLKTDPTRSAIHLKLLELYANRKSAEPFEKVAQQLHDLTSGNGPDWDKAVDLAKTMGLSGGLFGEEIPVQPAQSVVADEALAAVSEPPVEVLSPAAAAATVITQASELMPEAAPLAPVEPEPQPATALDEASLDFDLDLGTTSVPAVAAETPAAAPAEEAASLDFDFDLGTPDVAPAETEAQSTPAVEAAPSDGNSIDFALDIGSMPEAAPAAEEVAPTAPAGNEIDFDLDLGSDAAPESVADAAVETPMADVDASATEALDMPLDLPPVETAQTEASLPDEALPPAGGLADLKIDFDLDLDSPPAEASTEMPAAPAAADEAMADLDLDLGLDVEMPAASEPSASSAEVSASPVDIELPEIAADQGAEIELPPVDMAAFEEPKAEPKPVAPASELDFDLGLDADAGMASEPEAAASADDLLAESPADLAADLPVELPEIESPATPEVAETEAAADSLTSLPNIDLEAAEPEPQVEAEPAELDDPEVATKIELAQAYEEMGDREGARELLNEVLNEGSAAQKELARNRLTQLDA
jgi:pilus assembly protein FimV